MPQFGVTIPNNWGVPNPQDVLALGPQAEQMGYHSLWVMDHLFNTGYIRQRLQNRPYYHPLAILSHLAATTTRIKLGTSVLVLPYHNPIELAKYAATLDQISQGRLILGIGVGAMTEEFKALNLPMTNRGAITNESIALMRELWTNPNPQFHSPRWNIADLYFSPKPHQPRLPLWIGGSSPSALRRVARQGDGWHPTNLTPGQYAIGRQKIHQLAENQNRPPTQITMSARLEIQLPETQPTTPTAPTAQHAPSIQSATYDAAPSIQSAAHNAHNTQSATDAAAPAAPDAQPNTRPAPLPGDDIPALRAALEAYTQAGVTHFILALNSADTQALTRQMQHIAQEILPHFP